MTKVSLFICSEDAMIASGEIDCWVVYLLSDVTSKGEIC